MNEYKIEILNARIILPNILMNLWRETIKLIFHSEKKKLLINIKFSEVLMNLIKYMINYWNKKIIKLILLYLKKYYDTLIVREKVKEKKEREPEKIKQEELDKENTWRNKKNEKRINPLKDFEKAKERIKEYHLKLKFYDNIESYSSFKYDINRVYDYDIKNDYNNQLREFYKGKEREKGRDWDEKIERSKFKAAV